MPQSHGSQLHELTALELAAAFRCGQTTPREVVDHLLERVDAFSAAVGAFVTVTHEAARDQADRCGLLLRDRDANIPLLLGVPTAVKDLNNTAGVRTTYGSAVTVDTVPQVSDEVVLRMERAGMVSLGKTNTPEFGSPCYTEPEVAPPARTPYDLDRSAGGSSGGAGAAVAAGLLPVAQGSDGGGSIRIPASVCGLVGIKPSRGRISTAPLFGDVSGLGTAGPLATTVRDAAAMLDALCGPTVGDPAWAPPLPPDESYLGWADRPPGRLRIARCCAPPIGDGDLHPQVRAGYDAATRLLTELGHDVVDVDLALPPTTLEVFETVWSVSAAAWPIDPAREPELRPLSQWLRSRGRDTAGPAFVGALVGMRQAAAAVLRTLSPYDAVLTPTLAQPPALVGELRDDDDPARDFENQKGFTPFTAIWNVTGMPAVSLPMHWTSLREEPNARATASVLPVGMMLAGRPGDDHGLVALAAQIESACVVQGRWPHPETPFSTAHAWSPA